MMEETARRIAAEWHGGQGKPSLSFATTGTILPGLLDELRGVAADADVNVHPAHALDELARLIGYVEEQSRKTVTLTLPAMVYLHVDVEKGAVTAVHILPNQGEEEITHWDHTKVCDESDVDAALNIARTTCWRPVLNLENAEGMVWEA